MKKILGIILSVVLILSSFSMLAVSAETPLAPALPENTVAVLDADGVSKTLGDNGEWRVNWWEGRFSKKLTAPVDFTNADYIEFDIQYSNYEAFKTFIEENNVNIALHLTSAANPWGDRSAVEIMNYGVVKGNGWYHYKIPKSAFVLKQGNAVNWSAVDFWFLYSDASDVPFGEICSETLAIVNICGTVQQKPALPQNSTVIDENGATNTVGPDYANLWDRLLNSVSTPVDLSAADYIEFDIKYSDHDTLKAEIEAINRPFTLSFSSNEEGNKWFNRSACMYLFYYAVSNNNGWYHYRIPKSAFNVPDDNGNFADWSKVNNWMFGFQWGSGAVDKIADISINVKNICGTKHQAPTNAVATLDDEGVALNLGVDANQTMYTYYGRFYKNALAPTNFTTADYIEFDVYYQNYDKFYEFVTTKGINLQFNLTTGASDQWSQRSVVSNYLDYGTSVGNGRYHYVIPKTSFSTGANWASIENWYIIGEPDSGEAIGDLYTDIMHITNIYGTVAPAAPAAPANVVATIDGEGVATTMGVAYGDLWDRAHKAIETVNLTNANYIEFDLRSDMYDLLISKSKSYLLTICFVTGGLAGRWDNRACVFNVVDYEESVNGLWHHFAIPKSAFTYAIGNVDWANIDYWMIGFHGAPNEAIGDFGSCIFDIKNLCGTNRVEIDPTTPKLPGNAVSVLDEDGISNTLGVHGDWRMSYTGRFEKLGITPTDLSTADYIEFDIKYSDYNKIADFIETNGIIFEMHLTSSGTAMWTERTAVDIMKYGTDVGNGWYHYTIPKSAFTNRDATAPTWSEIDTWFLYGELSQNYPLGDLHTESLNVKNICGTTYTVKSNEFSKVDNYALIAEGKAVEDIATELNKVYGVNGLAVSKGNVVTGMTVKLEADGWVYDKVTVVVENDVDADGTVTASDLTLAKKFYFGTVASEIQNVALTGSKTAEPTILDYIQLKNALLG